MGAFFLLRGERTPPLEATLFDELGRQGFRPPRRFEAAGCRIYLYGKLQSDHVNAYQAAPQSFCLSVGTFFYRGAIGCRALEQFHADFRPAAIPWDDIAGQFCLIVAKDGAVHLLTDRIGLYKTYRNVDASLVTSSFLAAAAAAETLTIVPQSLYEYVLVGAPFANRTIFDEIELVDPDTLLCIRPDGVASTQLAPVPHDWRRGSFAELLEINLATLRRYFAMLADAFGARISTGLSGGYDSRLMLALLRACGVSPYVFVYGTEHDCDVQVARQIADGERFPLHHTDKRAAAQIGPDQFAALVESNLRFFDGYPYGGIFDDGADVRTRRDRCAHGELTLNGMAGELYRKPDLPNRPFTVREVVWRYYCGFDPAVCTARFHPAAYCDALTRKISTTLRAETDELARSDFTWIIPAFYARYWSGGTVSVNNRLSPALLPFCDLPIVREAVRLPIAYRYYGRFEAALIEALDPRLAAYRSGYGHDFASPPPLANIVSEWRATVRPPVYYRFTARPQAEHPYYLAAPYVGAVLDASFPYLRHYFHLDRVRDAHQYNRICTLEYLFQRHSARDSEATLETR